MNCIKTIFFVTMTTVDCVHESVLGLRFSMNMDLMKLQNLQQFAFVRLQDKLNCSV